MRDIELYGATWHHYSVRDALKQYAREEQHSLSRCVLLRSSWARKVWSALMYAALFWTITVGVFTMSFMEGSDDWLRLEGPLSVLCCADILVSFLSAYKDESHQLVTDLPSIARRYLSTWFLIDVISSLSVVDFFLHQSEVNHSRFVDLDGFLDIIRVLKFFKPEYKLRWVRQVKTLLGQTNVRIIKLLIVHLMLLHVLACLWFLTSRWSSSQSDSWVTQNHWMERSPFENYILSMFYIITTLATVGATDVTASSSEERSFTICLMIFGVGFFSYTISFVSIMTNHSESSELQKKLDAVENLARAIALPPEVTWRVIAHLRHTCLHESRTWRQCQRVLDDLPLFLSSELSLFMHYKMVAQVAFFQDKDPGFISEIVPKLQVMFFEKGRIIYLENSFAEEMYFLMKGRIKLLKHGASFVTYVAGSYFGELDILLGRLRGATAQTVEACEVLVLSKAGFLMMLDKYSTIREELLEVAHIRESRNDYTLKEILGFEDAKQLTYPKSLRKKSLRRLIMQENNRLKWRRLNTLDRTISDNRKWDIALKRHARKESHMLLVSAEQAFVLLEHDAHWNFVRRKKKALLSNIPSLFEGITPKETQMKSVMIRLKEYENRLQQGYHHLLHRLKRVVEKQQILKIRMQEL